MKYSYTHEESSRKQESKMRMSENITSGIEGNSKIPDVTEKWGDYFILQSDDYHDGLINKIYKILEMDSIQEKYHYDMKDVQIEIYEYELDGDTGEYEEVLDLTFWDNKFYNTIAERFEYGSVSIGFKLDFKQINFESFTVYSVFEITSIGSNHKDNDSDRNYIEFGNLITYLLNNPLKQK